MFGQNKTSLPFGRHPSARWWDEF